jgi:peptidoglycan hydrolase-like protein with peptidoglycan-binding domain
VCKLEHSANAAAPPTAWLWGDVNPSARTTNTLRRRHWLLAAGSALSRASAARSASIMSVLTTGALMSTTATQAQGSGRALASYYTRHQVLLGGVAHTWGDRGAPQRAMAGVVQVGVSQDAWFALRSGGELVRWSESAGGAASPTVLMSGVASFAAGQSGWFAIDAQGALWYTAAGTRTPPARLANDVIAACIGDSADYYITRDGALHVRGLAHRGQYGDGKLAATPNFVATARDAVAVKAHTGHAIYLRRDGTVLGTGGNRFGPLSSHGLGDKADRWGPIFEGASAIATGSRHSLALRADGSLWAWGEGFAIAPGKIFDGVLEVAAGDTATLALTREGALWQWERGVGPQRVVVG